MTGVFLVLFDVLLRGVIDENLVELQTGGLEIVLGGEDGVDAAASSNNGDVAAGGAEITDDYDAVLAGTLRVLCIVRQ